MVGWSDSETGLSNIIYFMIYDAYKKVTLVR